VSLKIKFGAKRRKKNLFTKPQTFKTTALNSIFSVVYCMPDIPEKTLPLHISFGVPLQQNYKG
jgi:hypothetical protein